LGQLHKHIWSSSRATLALTYFLTKIFSVCHSPLLKAWGRADIVNEIDPWPFLFDFLTVNHFIFLFEKRPWYSNH
jgi:hypothetical protein